MQGAIIGGVIGGVAVFILLLGGIFFFIKRRRESITQVRPFEPTPIIVVKPLETDSNLVQRSRNVHQLPSYESNQMLSTMTMIVPDAQT
jgi:hypothetical protein